MSDFEPGAPEGAAAVDLFDVVVAGRSLPALLAALDFAELGLRVLVTGDSGAVGNSDPRFAEGVVEPDPDGVIAETIRRVAAPLTGAGAATEFATDTAGPAGATGAGGARNGASGSAAREEEPSARSVPPRAPKLRDRTGCWHPQPAPAVLGIPAVPLAEETIALLGRAGAMRAYLDRVLPLLTIGKTRFLGELVRKRIGRAALEMLVEPQIRERFGVPAAQVEVAAAVPGLNEALSRAGALTSAALAYSDRHVARETGIEPNRGWSALTTALVRRLMAFQVKFVEEAPVAAESVRRDGAEIDPEGGALGEVAESGAVDSGTAAVGSVEAVVAGSDAAGVNWRIRMSSGERVAARALVVEIPGSAVSAGVEIPALSAALLPRLTRYHAVIGILPPAGLEAGDSALGTVGEWSIRVEPIGAQSGWTARLRGAARAEPGDVAESELREALSGFGLRAEPGAEWTAEWRSAPFATLDARHRAESAVAEAIDRNDALLPVGRALYGDDLAAALAGAHAGAVVLRRRLLGIAEA